MSANSCERVQTLSLPLGGRQDFRQLMSEILDHVEPPVAPERRHPRDIEIGIEQILPVRC